MLRLSNANASVIQGLIAQKGLKALFPWIFENKPPEGEGEKKTLALRAPLGLSALKKYT